MPEFVVSVSSRMQRFAIGAVAIVAILALALVALPYLVSGQQIRGVASRAIQSATGIVPRIDGPVRLVLLPRPAIQIQEVSLNDGSINGPAVGALQASLQFWPLLFGELKVATLTLERLRLAIEFSSDGRLLAGLPINPQIANDQDVPELRVVKGSVLIRIQGRDRDEIISGVDASLNWSGASLTATGSFMIGQKLANGTLMIADTVALAKGQRSALRLRIEAEPARLAYEGGISLQEAVLHGEGSLSADGRSLRDALALFGTSVPSPTGFGRFSVKSKVSLTPIAFTFTNLSLELDGNRADGGLIWKRDASRPILQGTLASDVTDLSIYQSPFRLMAASGREWNPAPIQISLLHNFDLDLRLSSGKLIAGKIEIGKVAIALGAKNRLFTAAIGEAQFYGGTLRGNASWNASEEIPSLRLDASFNNFDLERGLGGLSGFRRLEGKGSLALAITARGRSVKEVAEAISGKAELAMKQGALAGINAESVLRRLERRPLSSTGGLRGGRTPFERLTGSLAIDKGMANLSVLEIESPILKINLHGETSIPRREFDLRGTASLIRAPQAGSQQIAFDLPFLIHGNWDDPYLLPDPDALIRHSGAAAPLLDAVRGRAAREAMRNVIETVTGLRSYGELPANPYIELPPNADPEAISPVLTPALQPTQSR
jgi:AsmA protein